MSKPIAPATTVSSPSRLALEVLNDAWTIAILWHALAGARRFSEWTAQLPIPSQVLSVRLHAMCRNGLLRKVRAPENGHADYSLTARGADLYRVLLCMWSWESAWGGSRARVRLPRVVHVDCGHTARPVLTCGRCGRATGARDTHARGLVPAPARGWAGPGGRFRRSSVSRRASHGIHSWTVMQIIGDRWSNALMGAFFMGLHAFDEFERTLGISPAILSERLAGFIRLGIVRRATNEGDARRRFYRLTEKGLALYPQAISLIEWGSRWLENRSRPVGVMHRAFGHSFVPTLLCGRCGGVLEREAVRFSLA